MAGRSPPSHVVFGDAPLAQALAHRLAARVPTVLASHRPVSGPFLWRAGDVTTGEGVRLAAQGARRVYVVLDDDRSIDGLLVILGRASGVRGAVVQPLGAKRPSGLEGLGELSHVQVGPVWGPEDPLVEAWGSAIAAGQRVWVPDPGPIRPVAAPEAVAAVLEAGERPGVHWVLPGARPVQLADLATEIAARTGRPLKRLPATLGMAARRAGVDAGVIARWAAMPEPSRQTDGWRLGRTVGPADWVGDATRWRRGR